MAELETHFSLGFPKLNAFNYSSWKVNMKVLLIDRGSWEFISGETAPYPAEAEERDKRAYRWRKARAYTTIFQGVEQQFQSLISSIEDGKDAWEILKKNFEPSSRARLAGLIDEFYDIKFQPDNEQIGLFCKRVFEKRKMIEDAGFNMPDMLVCFQLIRKLPSEYDHIVQVLYRLGDEEFTVKKVEDELIIESGRILQKAKDIGQDIVSDAYAASYRHSNPSSKNLQSKSSGRVLGNNQNSTDNNRRKHGRRKDPGKAQVPQRKPSLSFNSETSGNNQQRASFVDANVDEVQNTTLQKDDCSSEWLIDTAATAHFCNRREWFNSFKSITATQVLVGDKNSVSEVIGVGNIHFNIKDKSKFVKVELLNVLYAPNMRRNLISGSKMDIAGLKIKWGENRMIVCKSDGTYFFTVNRVDKLYIVKGYAEINDKLCNESAFNVNLNPDLVHKRFCHINVSLLKHMSDNNIVRGIENFNGKLEPCDVCKVTKSTRTSLKSNYGITTKKVLEKVHMDLWGKSPINS